MAAVTHKGQVQKIQKVAVRLGGVILPNYSSVEMNGAICWGIVTDMPRNVIQEANIPGAQISSMGNHFVVYWPSVRGSMRQRFK